MQSMTGYGRARVCRDGRELSLEIKTVNHRYLDLSFRIPKELAFLEDVIRSEVNRSGLVRGHADISVTYANQRTDAQTVAVDAARLGAFTEAIRSCGELLSSYAGLTAADALSMSGALTVSRADEDQEAVTELAREALNTALASLLEMRAREGAHLAGDLLGHLAAFAQIRDTVAERAPQVPQEYRKRLEARLAQWLSEGADPQRVAQEVAIMADRCAIDEELSRLISHIDQFRQIVEGVGEAGRKLDFLLQEMNRETNTIGSKANDAVISQCVVDAKCVLEKMREQVQNVV